MSSSSHNKIPAFDRFMFFILRMKPLPVRRKEGAQVGVVAVLKLYAVSLRRYPWVIFFSVSTAILASLSNVIAPYIFKRFLDLLGQGVNAVQKNALIDTIFIFFFVSLLAWAFWRVCYFLNSYLAAGMLASLRQRAFAYLLGHSHTFFTNTFAGSLVQKVNRFAQSYDRLADRLLYDIIPIIVQVSFILYIMLLERPFVFLLLKRNYLNCGREW